LIEGKRRRIFIIISSIRKNHGKTGPGRDKADAARLIIHTV
jgi:hypothetical protein